MRAKIHSLRAKCFLRRTRRRKKRLDLIRGAAARAISTEPRGGHSAVNVEGDRRIAEIAGRSSGQVEPAKQ